MVELPGACVGDGRRARGYALYRDLGPTAEAREETYRRLFDTALDPEFTSALRAVTNGGCLLGDERFKQQIARTLSRRVALASPGRPPAGGDGRREIDLL